MAEVARLYYVRELTQQQIAERLGVSRFKVLRLLEQARTEGVVRFEIDEPVPVLDELSRGLEERFGINGGGRRDEVAGAAAGLLPRLLAAARRARRLVGQDTRRRSQATPRAWPEGARRPDLRRDRGSRAGHGADGARARFRGVVGRAVPSAPGAGGRGRTVRSGEPFARRREIFDDVTVALLGIGTRTAARGTCSSMSSTTTAASSPPSGRSRSQVAQLRRARVVAAAGGRRKRAPSRRARTRADRRAGHRRRVRPARAPMKTVVVTGAAGGIGPRRRPCSSMRASTVHGVDGTTRSRSSNGSTRSCARTGSAAAGSATDR